MNVIDFLNAAADAVLDMVAVDVDAMAEAGSADTRDWTDFSDIIE